MPFNAMFAFLITLIRVSLVCLQHQKGIKHAASCHSVTAFSILSLMVALVFAPSESVACVAYHLYAVMLQPSSKNAERR